MSEKPEGKDSQPSTQHTPDPTESSDSHNTRQLQTLLGKTIGDALSTPKVLSLLLAHPVIGNALLGILIFYTGSSFAKEIVSKENTEVIKAADVCEKTKRSVAEQLSISPSESIDREQLSVSSAGEFSEGLKDPLLSCTYKVETGKDYQHSEEVFALSYKMVPEGLTENIEEEKITTGELESICRDKEVFEKQLALKYGNLLKWNIKELGLELIDEPAIYPVFRWKCSYRLTSSLNQKQQKEPGPSDVEHIGLNLNDYCSEKYGDRGLTEAKYHDYRDPSSLYCVDPNFK